MRRIHLLFVLYGVEAAGAERVVLLLAKHLDKAKFKVVVCAFKGGRLLAEFEKCDVPVYILNKKRGLDFGVVGRLKEIIRDERIDIVHSHNFSANLWGRISGFLSRTPALIVTEHTVCTSKTAGQKIMDSLLSAVTYRIISVSERVRDTVIGEERIRPGKVVTIYNGVDDWEGNGHPREIYRRRLSSEFGLSGETVIVATVGRLEPPKGHEVLLKAVPAVLSVCPQARFLIVGDGYLREQLEGLAKGLGIQDQVVFAGFRDNVREILYGADLCLIPSIREGFSITLLEAMSVGSLIVATDVGGNAEALTHGESGIVVPPGDPALLAEGAIRVLGDMSLSTRMKERARGKFLERFHVDGMVRQTEMLYEAAMKNARSGHSVAR